MPERGDIFVANVFHEVRFRLWHHLVLGDSTATWRPNLYTLQCARPCELPGPGTVTFFTPAIFLKLTHQAPVPVPCKFMKDTFEASFHEMGSHLSLVPLRDIQQHGKKSLNL